MIPADECHEVGDDRFSMLKPTDHGDCKYIIIMMHQTTVLEPRSRRIPKRKSLEVA